MGPSTPEGKGPQDELTLESRHWPERRWRLLPPAVHIPYPVIKVRGVGAPFEGDGRKDVRWPARRKDPSASEGTPEGVRVVLCWSGFRHRKAFGMDSVPAYLLLYFLKIRKHAGEVGYLERRMTLNGLAHAMDEKQMLSELCDLHLIALSENENEVVFPQKFVELGPGLPAPGASVVKIPLVFVVAVRGRYVWFELLLRYVGWVATALVCGFAGGLAIEAKGNLLNAWVVAVLLCLALPLLVCLALVLTNPKAAR